MATKSDVSEADRTNLEREWLIFTFKAFATIIARKHGLVVPEVDFDSFSNERIEKNVRILGELAHLPSV